MISKVKADETLRVWLKFGDFGGSCSLHYFDPEFIRNQEIVLSALLSLGVRGYEKFD